MLLLIITAVIYRPLLFTSVDEQVAQAKGLHTQALNLVFMALLAGSVTIAVQAVGTLLIFALLVTPSASANAIARSPRSAILLSTVICFVSIMLGLLFSAMFPTPPSFAIVTVSTIIWGVTQVVTRSKR